MPLNLIAALHSDRPDPERTDKLALYAWLIGRWDMNGVIHSDNRAASGDEGKYESRGEIHAGWVLQGRAIQDVWIFPGVFYGTTLRVYDPDLDAWHILWSDPLKQYYSRQIGRARGRDIVQEGTNTQTGEQTRWSFTEITPDSFHWTGERLVGGADWRVQAEFFARRAAISGGGP